MSRNRCLASLIALLAVLTVVPGSEASRTAEDSRGLPRLLEADAGDLRIFPATVSLLAPQFLIDFNSSSYSGNEDLGLALTGRRVRFGYLLDGVTHNLVLGGPGGWGAVLGFQDAYERTEVYSYYEDDYYSRSDEEEWERTLRLAAGWRRVWTGGRLLEIGAAGNLIQSERDISTLRVRNSDVFESDLRWKADRGSGFEIALRTLDGDGGLQAALRFSYSDLHAEAEGTEIGARLIRRSGSLDLGWRIDVAGLDDVVAGVVAAWTKEQETGFGSYSPDEIRDLENTDYAGAVFLSVEKYIRENLVVRGGVRGRAYFSIDEYHDYELNGQEYILHDERRTSKGSTQSPELYLGAGWSWKNLLLEARISRAIYLEAPLVRWSARYEF